MTKNNGTSNGSVEEVPDNGFDLEVKFVEADEINWKGGQADLVLNGVPMTSNAACAILDQMTHNVMLSRRSFLDKFLDGRKDINQECGYAETSMMDAEFYKKLYEREGTATRIVELYPKESWKKQPTVYEDEDPEVETPFELAWTELNKNLRGTSFYEDEHGSPIWELLKRADILSGIGSYGVILLGLSDGQDLSKPVHGFEKGLPDKPVGSGLKLNFLRTFDEADAKITRLDNDVKSPRKGQPIEYEITMGKNELPNGAIAEGVNQNSIKVHWSRIVHLADNLMSSEIIGVPRIRPLYNRVYDLMKLYGSSAEGYWKGAFIGISIETNPNIPDNAKPDITKVKTAVERYQNSLQKFFILDRMTAKTLPPSLIDPTNHIKCAINAICIVLECPERVFMGSERGELSSGQDADSWEGRIYGRRCGYLTPRVIVPFVDRLILLGVLPQPEGYYVDWGKVYDLTPEQEANLALTRTQAMGAYVGQGVNVLMGALDFLTKEMHYTEDEAIAMLENVLGDMEANHPDATAVVPGQEPQYPEPETPVKLKDGERLVGPDGKRLTKNQLKKIVAMVNNAFFGHPGRPGKRGGSLPRGGGGRFISRAEHAKIVKAAQKAAMRDTFHSVKGDALKGFAAAAVTKGSVNRISKTVLDEVFGKKSSKKLSNRVTAWGTQGSSNKPFRLSFKSDQSLQRWSSNNKAQIHGFEKETPIKPSSRFKDRLTRAMQGSLRVFRVTAREVSAPLVAGVVTMGLSYVGHKYGITNPVTNVAFEDALDSNKKLAAIEYGADQMAKFFADELANKTMDRGDLDKMLVAFSSYLGISLDVG